MAETEEEAQSTREWNLSRSYLPNIGVGRVLYILYCKVSDLIFDVLFCSVLFCFCFCFCSVLSCFGFDFVLLAPLLLAPRLPVFLLFAPLLFVFWRGLGGFCARGSLARGCRVSKAL